MIARLIAWLRGLFSKQQPDPLAGLSRKHRRAIAFASSAEARMRRERTAARWAKRHANRKPSDNGAKYRRAYEAGYWRGGLVTLKALEERAKKQRTWKKPETVAA